MTKQLLEQKNEQMCYSLSHLRVSKNDEFSLRKAVKYFKRPTKRNTSIIDANCTWCKTEKCKAEAFDIKYVDEIRNFL